MFHRIGSVQYGDLYSQEIVEITRILRRVTLSFNYCVLRACKSHTNTRVGRYDNYGKTGSMEVIINIAVTALVVESYLLLVALKLPE